MGLRVVGLRGFWGLGFWGFWGFLGFWALGFRVLGFLRVLGFWGLGFWGLGAGTCNQRSPMPPAGYTALRGISSDKRQVEGLAARVASLGLSVGPRFRV